MAHDADFLVHQTFDEVHTLVPAFEFDRFRAAFFHETQRIADRVVVAGVKRSVRHIGDEQRALHGASNGFQVNQDLFECHRNGVAVSEHDISEAVADQNHVDSGFVENSCRRIVVSCQTNQALAALFAGL